MEKKHVILLTVIAIATLLISVIGATFAFFQMTATGTPEDITVTSASGLSITFDDGQAFSVSNIIPGWGDSIEASDNEKTVTVKNDSTVELSYDLKWKTVSNTFDTGDQENLKYSVKIAATGGTQPNTVTTEKEFTDKQVPTAPEDLVNQIHIKPGETQTYTITFKYVNKNEVQNSQGKKFEAVLDLTEGTIKAYSNAPVTD